MQQIEKLPSNCWHWLPRRTAGEGGAEYPKREKVRLKSMLDGGKLSDTKKQSFERRVLFHTATPSICCTLKPSDFGQTSVST